MVEALVLHCKALVQHKYFIRCECTRVAGCSGVKTWQKVWCCIARPWCSRNALWLSFRCLPNLSSRRQCHSFHFPPQGYAFVFTFFPQGYAFIFTFVPPGLCHSFHCSPSELCLRFHLSSPGLCLRPVHKSLRRSVCLSR